MAMQAAQPYSLATATLRGLKPWGVTLAICRARLSLVKIISLPRAWL